MARLMRVNFKTIKGQFFDRKVVQDQLDPIERRYLNRVGGLTRKIARRSMRSGGKKRRRSVAGEPPRYQMYPLLRKHLYYWYDRKSRSVTIAPAILRRGGAVPDTLEKGGIVPYGWMRGRALEPRPFMRPALERVEPQMSQIWAQSQNK